MEITNEMIRNIAKLSRLEIAPEEMEKIAGELEIIIDYVGKLNDLDTSKIEAMSHVLDVKNVFRSDEVKPSIDRELLLKEAPRRDEDSFIVPKTVE